MPPKTAPTVRLLHGEESFLLLEAARAQVADWTAPLVSDFGLDEIEAGGINAERLRDAILQGPFLDPHRVVVVRGIPVRRTDGLAAALKEVPDSTRLLLTVNARLPASNKLVKAVNGLPGGEVTEFARMREPQVRNWAQQRGRELGVPGAAVAMAIQASPPDLGILDSELRKLATFAETAGALNAETVRDLLAGGRQEAIFRVTDHLLPRPTATAWRVLDELLDREQPTTIAYSLARHLSLVLEVKTRTERGERLSQLQASMRQHSFVVQKAFDAARGVSAERLESGLRALLDYEWEVKSGQIDAEQGLRAVLAKL